METVEYIGYHGTDKDTAERIVSTNFIINQRHTGYLGKGVYFFEENKSITREYANSRHPGKIIKILECIIELPKDKVFDTTKESDAKKFEIYKEVVRETFVKKQLKIKNNTKDHFDGKIYDLIVDKENYLLIRAKTFTPTSRDREVGLYTSNVPNGVELCLKNLSEVIIKKYITE